MAAEQRALERPVTFTGVGLHSGAACRVEAHPAEPGEGIVFRRCDVNASPGAAETIKATPLGVVHAWHGTSLANEAGASIATVEHLMAAFAICAIDNVRVDVFGPEIPILDGSAAPFVKGLLKAGVAAQGAPRAAIIIDEPMEFIDGERYIRFAPCEEFRLTVAIEFDDCMIGRQSITLSGGDPLMLSRVVNARTFCRLQEIDLLRKRELIQGGTLENSIVVDGQTILNEGGLRDPEEFVLHKALDLMGDLYLLGAPICGAIEAFRPGHDLNTSAARGLYEQRLPGQDPADAPVLGKAPIAAYG